MAFKMAIQTARSFYLTVALDAVKCAEVEKDSFINSLSSIGYAKVMDSLRGEKQNSLVRDIVGRSALLKSMEDYDHVVCPLVKIAVVQWKSHCLQFNTGLLVTELSILHQWMEESLQDIAFIVMQSLDVLEGLPENFQSSDYIANPFEKMFPWIHAWQMSRNR